MYKVSAEGRDFIKAKEGYSSDLYKDAAGWSIGWGHFFKDKPPFSTIEKENAELFFDADIKNIESAIFRKITAKNVPQNVIDAVASFAFNVGTGEYLTKLAGYINKNDLEGAKNYILKFVYSQGKKLPALEARRKDEAEILLPSSAIKNHILPLLFFLLVGTAVYFYFKLKK